MFKQKISPKLQNISCGFFTITLLLDTDNEIKTPIFICLYISFWNITFGLSHLYTHLYSFSLNIIHRIIRWDSKVVSFLNLT